MKSGTEREWCGDSAHSHRSVADEDEFTVDPNSHEVVGAGIQIQLLVFGHVPDTVPLHFEEPRGELRVSLQEFEVDVLHRPAEHPAARGLRHVEGLDEAGLGLQPRIQGM